MAKFLVHRYSTEEIEVDADTEEGALEAAYQAEGDFPEVDYSWSVVAGPYELDEDDSPAADEG